MLPVAATSAPAQIVPTLVNTPVVENSGVRIAAYYSVPASVSNVAVNGFAQGSSVPVSTSGTGLEIPVARPQVFSSGASGLPSTGSATFFAQMLGQESTPLTQGFLVEYEKLIARAQVKYKPSNAFEPPPEPAGTFGKLLIEEKQTRRTTAAPSQPVLEEVVSEEAPVHADALPDAAPVTPAPVLASRASDAYAKVAARIPTDALAADARVA